MRFEYSIELARNIYASIKSDEEATTVCKANLESYLKENGLDYNKIEENEKYSSTIRYETERLSILFEINNGGPASVSFHANEQYGKSLLNEALIKKVLFGIPIFNVTVFEDSNLAIICFLNRSTYVSLDTPEEQAFRHRMRTLDDIIEKYGGNDFN